MIAGCEKPAQQTILFAPLKDGVPMEKVFFDKYSGKKTVKNRFIFVVRVRIASVEVPVGMASASEEIWSYLDEEPVEAVHSTGLVQNGLRVGVGVKESFADIVRVLKRMTGKKFSENNFLNVPGETMPIVLSQSQESQTIFTFHDDMTLTGANYPDGDNLLSVICTLDEDDPSAVVLTAVPQIRSAHHMPFIENETGKPNLTTKPLVYSFNLLTFQTRLEKGSFLVIGPSYESRRPLSLGYHFLVRQKEGVEFETVFVLIPEVFAAPVK